jgi:hypothetical protein
MSNMIIKKNIGEDSGKRCREVSKKKERKKRKKKN